MKVVCPLCCGARHSCRVCDQQGVLARSTSPDGRLVYRDWSGQCVAWSDNGGITATLSLEVLQDG